MRTRILGGAALPLLLLAALLVPAAPARATTYAVIEGTGSTWSEPMVGKWIADVNTYGMPVIYTGGGSTKGRRDFANGTVDFAISELPYQGVDELGQEDTSQGRAFAYVPFVAGGTALTYQLKVGGRMITDLRLTPRTVVRIFTGGITRWDDPAIRRDNAGRRMPDRAITPVVRADGSGSTWQFTSWLAAVAPGLWSAYRGTPGPTSYYPAADGMVAQSGSDQVMNTVRGYTGNGTIAYLEYAYPHNVGYPVVALKNKAGRFVQPVAHNVKVALRSGHVDGDPTSPDYLTADLADVYRSTARDAYPISSYSYLILPTAADDPRMSTAKRQTLADFVGFSLCKGRRSPVRTATRHFLRTSSRPASSSSRASTTPTRRSRCRAGARRSPTARPARAAGRARRRSAPVWRRP